MLSEDEIFSCLKCGDCCKGYGGTYVTPEDVLAISAFLQTDSGRFIEAYCTISGGRPLLAQGPDGYCVFFDRVCRVHPVKPRMCREWPYIQSILIDPKNWEIMAASCPGIRTGIPNARLLEIVKIKRGPARKKGG
jgi:uncharacterized protein